MALAAYVVSASLFAKKLVIAYLRLVHAPLMSYIDNVIIMSHQSYFVIYYLILAVLLGLPLLAFALIGDLFCRGLATAERQDQIMPHQAANQPRDSPDLASSC